MYVKFNLICPIENFYITSSSNSVAIILLSSGDQLLCFPEMMHMQGLSAAINWKLLLLPIYHLWRYVTYVPLKKWFSYIHVWDIFYIYIYIFTFETCFTLASCYSTYWVSQQSSIWVHNSLEYHYGMLSIKNVTIVTLKIQSFLM